jgi:hypothetical protein
MRRTDQTTFSNLAITTSDGAVVARVRGSVIWTVEDGVVTYVSDLMLADESGGMIEIDRHSALSAVVQEALNRHAKGLPNRKIIEDHTPVSPDPYDSASPPDLDTPATEGAERAA